LQVNITVGGLRVVEAKGGPRAGKKTLFFSTALIFRTGTGVPGEELTLLLSGWRWQEGKLLPPATSLGFGKFLNLTYVDTTLAYSIVEALKKFLEETQESSFKEFLPIEGNINDMIRTVTITEEKVRKFFNGKEKPNGN
jgi:hypothetical protein